jgi:co-chaperonin GroES (HSP10)
MSVKAVIHRLVVKPVSLEQYDDTYATAKKMGFEIPKVEANKYDHTQIDQGTVVDIGPTAFRDYVQKYNLDIPVKLGDMVTYARHSGKIVKDPFDDQSEELIVINDEDVICVYLKEE